LTCSLNCSSVKLIGIVLIIGLLSSTSQLCCTISKKVKSVLLKNPQALVKDIVYYLHYADKEKNTAILDAKSH